MKIEKLTARHRMEWTSERDRVFSELLEIQLYGFVRRKGPNITVGELTIIVGRVRAEVWQNVDPAHLNRLVDALCGFYREDLRS